MHICLVSNYYQCCVIVDWTSATSLGQIWKKNIRSFLFKKLDWERLLQNVGQAPLSYSVYNTVHVHVSMVCVDSLSFTWHVFIVRSAPYFSHSCGLCVEGRATEKPPLSISYNGASWSSWRDCMYMTVYCPLPGTWDDQPMLVVSNSLRTERKGRLFTDNILEMRFHIRILQYFYSNLTESCSCGSHSQWIGIGSSGGLASNKGDKPSPESKLVYWYISMRHQASVSSRFGP